MIHDYIMYRPDLEFTKQFLIGIDNVLNWFDQRVLDNGILGKLQWPNYMDAAPGFGPAGSPPTAEKGQSAQISLLYAFGLEYAAEIYKIHGEEEQAQDYRNRSKSIKHLVYKLCYDTSRGLFAETPEKIAWTQHTNILAVLTDAIPANEQKEMVLKILNDNTLIPAQIYFKFYLMQALKKVGLGDLYLDNLKPWEIMIEQGLTTFAERALEGRSDCHAWSAHPCFDFLATVCGIESRSPGFTKLRIQPHLGNLKNIRGKMPHPNGNIIFEFRKTGESGLSAYIDLPENIVGEFIWKDHKQSLTPGKQELKF
jgi:hypothetical protein